MFLLFNHLFIAQNGKIIRNENSQSNVPFT